ncbi:MAG: hypothetical protein ABI239_14080 [Aquihabitans sp.]
MNFHRTPLAQPAPNGSGRRWLAMLGIVVALTVLGAGAAGVAEASGAQDPAISTTSGAFGTEPAVSPGASTTTAPSSDEETPTTSGRSAEIDEENRRIVAIVGGLVVVAIALLLLTIRYWRTTRPVQGAAAASDVQPVLTSRSRTDARRGRRSRRAIAGADHAGADETWEPRATGEQPRIDPPSSVRAVRPSKEQRASALSGDGK